jgi:hypothetical protein
LHQSSSHSEPQRRWPRHLVHSIGILFVALWLIGLLGSDRWMVTQWPSWLPAIILLPIGIGLALYSRRAIGRIVWVAVAMLGAIWWFGIDQPWRPGTAEPDGLTLVQWTMSHDKSDREAHAQVIVDLDADITILTHGYGVRGTDTVLDWLGPEIKPYKYGHFTVLTRLPVRRLQPIASSNDIHLQGIEIDTTERLGQPLHIVAVDLPSNPMRSRMDIAHTARRWLDRKERPETDIALGDFNMRGNSAALRFMFPRLHHAWSLGGVGWGPTFPRVAPIYHIDHVLVADWLLVQRDETIDPGVGRHRLQQVWLQAK